MDNPEKGIKNKAAAFTHNGKLLNDARKKCLAATDGFQYLTNRSTFIRRNGINSTNKDVKRCAIVANAFKYPNYLKASSKLAARNNLCAVKGPIHHKIKVQPKSRSSNALIGSQGKVLEIQAKKKHKDKTNGDVYSGSKNSVSSRISSKHLNYLKASSKLKERSCSDITTSNRRVKSQLQNKGKNFVHGNAYLPIKDKNLELQTVIDENEKLKHKLTNIIESLQDIIFQCKKGDGEVKHSKYHAGCQKQEIKSQKSSFKFPQIDKSNKLNKTDFLKTPLKKLNQRTNHQYQMATLNSDLDRSVFKSDLIHKKAPNPTQYLIELEKQNKLIIGNLNELKESLKRTHKLQTTKLEPSNTRKQQPLKTNTKKMNSISKSLEPPAAVTPEEIKATVPLKERPEMLREMIQFNKMRKDKGSCFQDHETINLDRKTQANDGSVKTTSISNSLSKETKLKSKQDFSPISSTINYTKTSEIQRQSIEIRKNSQEYSPQATKIKKISSHRLPRYNVDKMKNKEEKVQYVSSAIAQRDISQNKLSFKAKSNGRKVYPDSFSITKDAKSSGDNAMVLPKAS